MKRLLLGLCIGLFLAGNAANASLVALYECESGINDTSGSGFDLNDSGTIGYSTNSAVGTKSCQFSGDDNLSTTTTIGGDSSNTIAFWLKGTVSASANILMLDDGSGVYRKVSINSATNELWFVADSGMSPYPTVSFLEADKFGLDGAWWHIAISTVGAGNGSIYVNGKKLDTDDGSSVFASDIFQLENIITLGGSGFVGELDDVRIYDNVLSDSEILDLCKLNTTMADKCGKGFEEADAVPEAVVAIATQTQSSGENSAPPAVVDSQISVKSANPDKPYVKTISLAGGWSTNTWFQIFYRGKLIAETQPGQREVDVDISELQGTRAVDGFTVCAVNEFGNSCDPSPMMTPLGIGMLLGMLLVLVGIKRKSL